VGEILNWRRNLLIIFVTVGVRAACDIFDCARWVGWVCSITAALMVGCWLISREVRRG